MVTSPDVLANFVLLNWRFSTASAALKVARSEAGGNSITTAATDAMVVAISLVSFSTPLNEQPVISMIAKTGITTSLFVVNIFG